MSGLRESPISAISLMRKRPTWAYALLFFSLVSFISVVLSGLVIPFYQNLDKFYSPSTASFTRYVSAMCALVLYDSNAYSIGLVIMCVRSS